MKHWLIQTALLFHCHQNCRVFDAIDTSVQVHSYLEHTPEKYRVVKQNHESFIGLDIIDWK